MKNFLNIKLIFFILFITANISIANEVKYRIIKLVNEQVITNYDLEQRVKLYAVLKNAQINSDNYNIIATEILSTMVDEKLQLEKINEYKINISEEEVIDYLTRAYTNEKVSIDNVFNALDSNNINRNVLKQNIKINLGWQTLTSRLFYRSSNVNLDDINRLVLKDPTISIERAEQILLQEQINLRAEKLLRDIRSEANIENR